MDVTINVKYPERYQFGYAESNNSNLIVWQDSNVLYIPSEGTFFLFTKNKSTGKTSLKAKFVSCNDQEENKVVILSVERIVATKNKVEIKSIERVKSSLLSDTTMQDLFTGQSNIKVTLPLLNSSEVSTQRILTTVVSGIKCYSNSVQLQKNDIFSSLDEFVISIDLNVVPSNYFVYCGMKAILPSGNTNEAFVKGKLSLGSNELKKVTILIGKEI